MSAGQASPAASGSGRGVPVDPVRALQHALYRAAKADPGRRFHALYDKIRRRDVLWRAWAAVRRNNGAPGIDKITLAAVEEYGVTRLLDELASELEEHRYRPLPARRVYIPKPGAPAGEQRPLSIPTVADRVVQASLKAVLEPIFEADFKPCSYGFRPNRRAQDAIAEIHHYGTSGYRWVLECDIKACFDEISHVALMDRLRARIKDKRVCALVKAFLKSGVLTELGDREETLTGTPQGGILPRCSLTCRPVSAGRSFRPAMASGDGLRRAAAQTQEQRPRQLETHPLCG